MVREVGQLIYAGFNAYFFLLLEEALVLVRLGDGVGTGTAPVLATQGVIIRTSMEKDVG